MDTKPRPQYARIEVPFGVDFFFCHCPVCGKAAANSEADGLTVTPCPHLEFIFICEISEFEHTSDDFSKRLNASKIDRDELDFDTFPNALEELGYGNDMLAMEVNHGGMACGPVWSAEIYGYRFGIAEPGENS